MVFFLVVFFPFFLVFFSPSYSLLLLSVLARSPQEKQMLQVASSKEMERLRQSLLSQAQKLEAAQQRAAELETQLSKKEHLIAEQKKFLEDVKLQAKYAHALLNTRSWCT